jgi:glutathione S-transferase
MPIWGGTNHQHGPIGQHVGAGAAGSNGKPRLVYFAGWGLAEQIRWILAATKIEWDQVALSSHDEFVALRDVSCALAFGQLPLLEIDGMRLVQSQAMIRHVARRGGLVGRDDAEMVIIDMVGEAVRDARSGLSSYPFATDKDGHADSCRERLLSKELPYLEMAIRRGGGTIVPSGISYADVLIVEMILGYVDMLGAGLLDDLPWLGALRDKVLALEGIVAYLGSDKRYPFPKGDVGQAYVANVNAVLGR